MTTVQPPGERRAARRWGLLVVLLVAVLAAVAVTWVASGAGTGAEPPRANGQAAGPSAGPTPSSAPSGTPPPSPAPSPSPSPTPSDVSFSVVAGGDVLPHSAVIASTRTASGYDFGPLLQPLDPWVRGADLALCHLEVPVAPPGTPPTGYPSFGAPAELIDALRAQGWDGCSTASNHSLDRGAQGAVATLDALDAAGLGHVGTARTEREGQEPQLYRLERDGRTLMVAHVAATYGLNGRPGAPDPPWIVTLLEPATLVARATAARAAGADLVVASVHCCREYVTEPTAEQVTVAQALADSGVVDLVLGHHAHVPQPVARLPGGPRGEGMWVFHGLGNLLSNQDVACCPAGTSAGVLATAHVRASAGGPAHVTAVEWTGVTVDRGAGHRLHALPDVPAGTATLPAAEIAARRQRVAEAVGTEPPERTTPLQPTGPPPVVVPRPR